METRDTGPMGVERRVEDASVYFFGVKEEAIPSVLFLPLFFLSVWLSCSRLPDLGPERGGPGSPP